MDNATVLHILTERFASDVLASNEFRGDLAIGIRGEALLAVGQFLRDDPALRYTFLESLTGVDYLGREPRFEVALHLVSFANAHRICLKVGALEDDPHLPSVSGLWPTANYQEREAFDLLGIVFDGHPALVRILMPDDWVGHPLRKDHPLGYEEVAFSFNQERIYAQKPFAKE